MAFKYRTAVAGTPTKAQAADLRQAEYVYFKYRFLNVEGFSPAIFLNSLLK